MLSLPVKANAQRPLRVLCLGAHSDDIEIGCSGTVIKMIKEGLAGEFYWVVFSGSGAREQEARKSAETLLQGARSNTIVVKDFRDGFFPYVAMQIKECFEELKAECTPDVIFTHYRNDLHQDHRTISELTWNTFRDHLILEYEIPKYDGDFGSPNVYSPLSEAQCARKVRHILDTFQSQSSNTWFDEETFRAVLRLRGVESNAPAKLAEGFYCRKLALDFGCGSDKATV